MNKKCLICLFVCLACLISLTACRAETPLVLSQQEETTRKDDTTPSTEHFDPSHIEEFNALTDIKNFFSDGSTVQINGLPNTAEKNIYQYEPQSNANQFVNAAASLYYPVANISSDAVDFGSHYLPWHKELDIIYVVDNTQYCFIYFFDYDSDWYYGETPVYSDVEVGPYTIDFYELDKPHTEDQRYFLGHIAINGIDLLVKIQGVEGTPVEAFSFAIFDFVPFAEM